MLRASGTKPLDLKAQVFNLLHSRKIAALAGYTVASATPLFRTQARASVFRGATGRL